eukprot:symbB.v1.2.008008.t1/scaffold471.1/size199268/14
MRHKWSQIEFVFPLCFQTVGSGEDLDLASFEKALELILLREGFSRKEYDEFQMLYNMSNRDSSGEVEVAELKVMLHWLGFSASHMAPQLASQVGHHGTGSLNFTELRGCMRQKVFSQMKTPVMRPGSIRTAPRDHGATAPAPAIQHPPLTNPWKLLSVLPLVVLQRPKRRKVLLKAYNGREVDSPNGLGVEATQKLEKLQTLTGETAEIQAEAIFHLFSFELDPVQREAALELSRGKDVMCCLPTGSGKTAIAVFAAWQVLMRGGKFIYTSPLKALSAQKRREFAQIFGPEAVGLVTGDHCVIPDAPLVVMTTEILRNKLYPGNSSLTHTPMPIIVVLDELHWISDPARGRAWEEVIINGPSWIQFLSLSGSVGGDPQEFCDWMTSARSRVCSLVVSQVRPVPLHFYMMMRSSKDPQRQRCFRLWDEAEVPLEESQIHPKLHAQSAWSDVREGGTNAAGMDRVIALSKTLRRLQSLGWLPSLSFALRRRQCEEQVKVAFMMICLGGLGGAPSNGPIPPFPKQLRLPKRLVSSAERKQIQSAINVFEEQFPDLKLSDITKTVMMAGLASHHAGQMPAQRALVECLFERGLVKMIFATETLAAGIHMPARSVIITALQKKDAFGLRCLNGTEVLQMSGRAGRRGLDQSGHAIVHGPVIWTMDTLKSGPLPLSSSFSPSYDMLCALFTGGKSEQDVAQLVEKSFAAFLADDLPDQESRELEYHRYGELLARVRDVLERSGCTVQDVKEYKKLKDQHDMDSRLCFAGHSDDDLDLFLDDALPQLDDGLGDTIDSHDLDRNKAARDVWAAR